MTTSRSILFLGGTGVISAACVRHAVDAGHRVTVLNRGRSSDRALPDGVEHLVADLRDPSSLDTALAGREYDAVAQFLAFTPDQVAADVARFEGRTGQYLFVSSASAYQKPPARLPVRETTPLRNPFWQYSRDKAACEDVLTGVYRERGFPATVVRPSHTYDETGLPTLFGWTDVARMRAGKPVVVHGDGTSLWTITHARDVAVGIVGLLGHPAALGEAFTVTGDHAPTWDQVYTWLGRAAGVEPDLVHVASETIALAAPDLGPALMGDKAHSMVFDTTRLRDLVPSFGTTVTYDEGAAAQVAWFDAHPDRQVVDPDADALSDRLVAHARAL
ncbi:SDR family oxidoreductase [Luteimicrobium subarcticum]|uniref:Nucleoside-diphosphate-sugar epimerase n=1 Tax=Luteimicrobium subarcticum TaxID=620910 RepID=A0A2M8WVX0_9MICO|nr:SDR family oxidoreductase [Luteimicrobium subarcticum]PJI95075.1 nucleoside-diphosphate-sugar epimerase [Luteimicrobium subarcticum]